MLSLRLSGITKHFGNVTAVHNFNLEVKEGELISLLGPSGCGKTTVLRCVAGFEKPDEGEICFFDKVINDLPPEKRDIALLFQAYALFPNMTVKENIAFPLMIRGESKSVQNARVKELLSMIQLEDLESRSIAQLSGGQKQRVALARALARDPKILLLDEPLSALDAKIRQELRHEIRRIQTQLGITTIYVTHDQEEALSISDQVVVMEKGLIQQMGTPAEIYRRPQTCFVAGFVGTMNLFPGEVVGEKLFQWEHERFVVEDAQTWEKNTRAHLCIRPEVMSVVCSKNEIPQGWNALPAEVEPLTFLGSTIRTTLRAASGMLVIADLPAEAASCLSVGQQVYACFKTDVGVLVKEKL